MEPQDITQSARWTRAFTHVRQGDWEEALPDLEILLKDDPDNSDYLNLKAHSLLNLGDYDKAIACFESWVTKHPAAETWMFYGYALVTAGRPKDSIAAYREAISLKPNLGEAYWSLSNLKTFRFTAAEIIAMHEALDRAELDARSRWLMHFALGKALEDTRQYPASFEQYRKGNALFRGGLRYNAENTTKFVRRCKAVFTPEFFAERTGAGSVPDPIFIVGLPRAGSTLVEQILASHSMVEGTKELTVLNAIAMRLADYERTRIDRYPEILRELKPEELSAAGDEYIARTRIHRKSGRPFFIDKTPGNFHHLGLIRLILPNAKIIDARRHPLGCGFAVFRQYFPQAFGFAFDLAEIGRYYRDYVELMAHFDSTMPGRIHRVIYEELVADPEREIRRLLDHCGLPFEESCLRFYETERGVLTPSAQQVRQPIFADAVEQWRHFEPWLDPMKTALGDVLECYPDTPKFGEAAFGFGAQRNLSANYRLNATLQGPTDRR
jgi:tetratricopeptide (TPR) repeat protein